MATRDQPADGWTVVLRRQPARIVEGRPEGGYTEVFELICCHRGDHPNLGYREVSPELQLIRGPYPIAAGEVNVRMEFAADAPKPATGGEVTLYINDIPVGKGRMDHTVPIRFSGYAGMDIGRDNGGVVDLSYEDKKPFPFTGAIHKVVFDIKAQPLADDEDELHTAAQHGHTAHALSG